jgi:hypothetical protein
MVSPDGSGGCSYKKWNCRRNWRHILSIDM